jgi:uncharacterized protein (DUF433 family)
MKQFNNKIANSADHPFVDFVDGPTGRRAHIKGTGADVWEVVATILDNGGDQVAAADYLSMDLLLVEAANNYYLSYPDEISERIEQNKLWEARRGTKP